MLVRLGGFDERLVRNQDYELNARIRAAGEVILLDPSIRIEYFNQADVGGLLRQARVTGRWNAFTWYLAPHAFRARHAAPGALLLFLLLGGGAAMTASVLRGAYLAVVALYLAAALASSVQQAVRLRDPLLLLTLPFAFLAYHLSYGLGTLHGALLVVLGRVPFGADSRPWAGAPTFRVNPRASR